ncbi:hypothetical protein [Variovorax sp. YR750]|uniref:hypothetical protein n=1 Tax=Variovorax sp. YR750 TaxID=1884384 RepID=UPI001C42E85B|nr:hypothetical protein [Variovorax sp. YR750]
MILEKASSRSFLWEKEVDKVSLGKLREELKKLDVAVDMMSLADRAHGAEAIRDHFSRHHRALTAQDEKVLAAFAEDKVGLSEFAEQFEGRI